MREPFMYRFGGKGGCGGDEGTQRFATIENASVMACVGASGIGRVLAPRLSIRRSDTETLDIQEPAMEASDNAHTILYLAVL